MHKLQEMKQYKRKILSSYLSSKITEIKIDEELNLVHVQLLLKNISREEKVTAWDINDNYVVKFDKIEKGKLFLSINFDEEYW